MKRKKLPQQDFSANVTRLSHEGRGIAEIDGKTTFLFNALPDETVQFRYTQKRNSFDQGNVTKVLEASPLRVDPQCDYFGLCGGCSLQHLKHSEQITLKQKNFLELLQHQANTQPETILEPIFANPWGYRRKARLSIRFVAKKPKIMVGFRERNGRYVADMNHCEILHPSVGQNINGLRDLLHHLHCREDIPQLEIAVTDQTTAVILRHLKPLITSDLEALEQFCGQKNWRLYLQPKGMDSIHVQYPKNTDPLIYYTLPEYNLTLGLHPAGFMQVNHDINQQMIARAIELLDLNKNDKVLDLFCGIGNFSLPIAKYCKQVIGIEGDKIAVDQATKNAKANKINNTNFYMHNLFECENTSDWATIQYDKIILDPPRAGAKEMLEQLLPKWGPKKIVYISCNPATLARDSAIILAQGYRLNCAGIMDMFPHTQHVESIASFEKIKS